MSDRSVVYLKDLATGEPVEAALIDGVNLQEVELAEQSWKPHIEAAVAQLLRNKVPSEKWPQHLHWNWITKYKRTANFLAYRWLGLERDDNMQGLMMLDTATSRGRIEEQSGKPLVYIHYLATAPWNSPEIVQYPKYGWIGRVFIAAAIQISESEGFKGRIGLHALPQADTYYSEICGMTDLGKDPTKANLKYFEMTPTQAAKFSE